MAKATAKPQKGMQPKKSQLELLKKNTIQKKPRTVKRSAKKSKKEVLIAEAGNLGASKPKRAKRVNIPKPDNTVTGESYANEPGPISLTLLAGIECNPIPKEHSYGNDGKSKSKRKPKINKPKQNNVKTEENNINMNELLQNPVNMSSADEQIGNETVATEATMGKIKKPRKIKINNPVKISEAKTRGKTKTTNSRETSCDQMISTTGKKGQKRKVRGSKHADVPTDTVEQKSLADVQVISKKAPQNRKGTDRGSKKETAPLRSSHSRRSTRMLLYQSDLKDSDNPEVKSSEGEACGAGDNSNQTEVGKTNETGRHEPLKMIFSEDELEEHPDDNGSQNTQENVVMQITDSIPVDQGKVVKPKKGRKNTEATDDEASKLKTGKKSVKFQDLSEGESVLAVTFDGTKSKEVPLRGRGTRRGRPLGRRVDGRAGGLVQESIRGMGRGGSLSTRGNRRGMFRGSVGSTRGSRGRGPRGSKRGSRSVSMPIKSEDLNSDVYCDLPQGITEDLQLTRDSVETPHPATESSHDIKTVSVIEQTPAEVENNRIIERSNQLIHGNQVAIFSNEDRRNPIAQVAYSELFCGKYPYNDSNKQIVLMLNKEQKDSYNDGNWSMVKSSVMQNHKALQTNRDLYKYSKNLHVDNKKLTKCFTGMYTSCQRTRNEATELRRQLLIEQEKQAQNARYTKSLWEELDKRTLETSIHYQTRDQQFLLRKSFQEKSEKIKAECDEKCKKLEREVISLSKENSYLVKKSGQQKAIMLKETTSTISDSQLKSRKGLGLAQKCKYRSSILALHSYAERILCHPIKNRNEISCIRARLRILVHELLGFDTQYKNIQITEELHHTLNDIFDQLDMENGIDSKLIDNWHKLFQDNIKINNSKNTTIIIAEDAGKSTQENPQGASYDVSVAVPIDDVQTSDSSQSDSEMKSQNSQVEVMSDNSSSEIDDVENERTHEAFSANSNFDIFTVGSSDSQDAPLKDDQKGQPDVIIVESRNNNQQDPDCVIMDSFSPTAEHSLPSFSMECLPIAGPSRSPIRKEEVVLSSDDSEIECVKTIHGTNKIHDIVITTDDSDDEYPVMHYSSDSSGGEAEPFVDQYLVHKLKMEDAQHQFKDTKNVVEINKYIKLEHIKSDSQLKDRNTDINDQKISMGQKDEEQEIKDDANLECFKTEKEMRPFNLDHVTESLSDSETELEIQGKVEEPGKDNSLEQINIINEVRTSAEREMVTEKRSEENQNVEIEGVHIADTENCQNVDNASSVHTMETQEIRESSPKHVADTQCVVVEYAEQSDTEQPPHGTGITEQTKALASPPFSEMESPSQLRSPLQSRPLKPCSDILGQGDAEKLNQISSRVSKRVASKTIVFVPKLDSGAALETNAIPNSQQPGRRVSLRARLNKNPVEITAVNNFQPCQAMKLQKHILEKINEKEKPASKRLKTEEVKVERESNLSSSEDDDPEASPDIAEMSPVKLKNEVKQRNSKNASIPDPEAGMYNHVGKQRISRVHGSKSVAQSTLAVPLSNTLKKNPAAISAASHITRNKRFPLKPTISKTDKKDKSSPKETKTSETAHGAVTEASDVPVPPQLSGHSSSQIQNDPTNMYANPYALMSQMMNMMWMGLAQGTFPNPSFSGMSNAPPTQSQTGVNQFGPSFNPTNPSFSYPQFPMPMMPNPVGGSIPFPPNDGTQGFNMGFFAPPVPGALQTNVMSSTMPATVQPSTKKQRKVKPRKPKAKVLKVKMPKRVNALAISDDESSDEKEDVSKKKLKDLDDTPNEYIIGHVEVPTLEQGFRRVKEDLDVRKTMDLVFKLEKKSSDSPKKHSNGVSLTDSGILNDLYLSESSSEEDEKGNIEWSCPTSPIPEYLEEKPVDKWSYLNPLIAAQVSSASFELLGKFLSMPKNDLILYANGEKCPTEITSNKQLPPAIGVAKTIYQHIFEDTEKLEAYHDEREFPISHTAQKILITIQILSTTEMYNNLPSLSLEYFTSQVIPNPKYEFKESNDKLTKLGRFYGALSRKFNLGNDIKRMLFEILYWKPPHAYALAYGILCLNSDVFVGLSFDKFGMTDRATLFALLSPPQFNDAKYFAPVRSLLKQSLEIITPEVTHELFVDALLEEVKGLEEDTVLKNASRAISMLCLQTQWTWFEEYVTKRLMNWVTEFQQSKISDAVFASFINVIGDVSHDSSAPTNISKIRDLMSALRKVNNSIMNPVLRDAIENSCANIDQKILQMKTTKPKIWSYEKKTDGNSNSSVQKNLKKKAKGKSKNRALDKRKKEMIKAAREMLWNDNDSKSE